ncbi:hypothetical protein B0H19DRAFT_1277772 [Mycena capillaripes]|nr:hypothetical protein B0H19DRAFT_1277772 [Mycena capillaripes]
MGKLFAKIVSDEPTAYGRINFQFPSLYPAQIHQAVCLPTTGAHEFFISTLNYIHSIFRGSTNVSCNCTIRSTLTVQLQSHVCERCGNVVGPILDISVERDKTGEGVSEDNTVVLARFALSCLFKRNRFAGIRSQKSSTQSNTGAPSAGGLLTKYPTVSASTSFLGAARKTDTCICFGDAQSRSPCMTLTLVPSSRHHSFISFLIRHLPNLACLSAELAERASYYATTGTKLRKGPDLNQHGALGMGLQYASGTTAFALIAYVVPISDHHLRNPGRIRQPRHYDGRRGAVGALDAGIVKPNVAPTVLDQYTHQKLYVTTTQQGERVIVNPEMTIQRIITIYYDFRHRLDLRREDRWLLAGLRAADHHLLHRAHHLPGCAEDVIWLALRKNKLNPWARDFWVKVSRARLAAEGFPVNYPISWSRTSSALAIFLYILFYQLNDGTIGPLNSNQGAAMIRNCAPNDLLNNFNALGLVVLAPIVAYIVYPGLEKLGIKCGPIRRMRFLAASPAGSSSYSNTLVSKITI